jgi:hypothetical protein
VISVKDVYIDLIETLSGISTEDDSLMLEARGEVVVEARVHEGTDPRVGFRLKTGPEMGSIGFDGRCERHI